MYFLRLCNSLSRDMEQKCESLLTGGEGELANLISPLQHVRLHRIQLLPYSQGYK